MNDKDKLSYGERVKLRQEKILKSPEFKRSRYVNKQMGMFLLLIWPLVFLCAYLAEKFFGISAYIGCAVFAVIGIAIAGILAERKAQNFFKGDK